VEKETTGRVLVEIKVENPKDLYAVEQGYKTLDEARTVVIPDALVDTGATSLSMPPLFLKLLGLTKRSEKRVRTSGGDRIASLYDAVRLTIQGRPGAKPNRVAEAVRCPRRPGPPLSIGHRRNHGPPGRT